MLCQHVTLSTTAQLITKQNERFHLKLYQFFALQCKTDVFSRFNGTNTHWTNRNIDVTYTIITMIATMEIIQNFLFNSINFHFIMTELFEQTEWYPSCSNILVEPIDYRFVEIFKLQCEFKSILWTEAIEFVYFLLGFSCQNDKTDDINTINTKYNNTHSNYLVLIRVRVDLKSCSKYGRISIDSFCKFILFPSVL